MNRYLLLAIAPFLALGFCVLWISKGFIFAVIFAALAIIFSIAFLKWMDFVASLWYEHDKKQSQNR